MKTLFKNIAWIMILFLSVRCNKEEVISREYPRIITLPVSNITTEGALFKADIIYRGDSEVINYGFIWDEYEDLRLENSDWVIYTENIQSDNFSDTLRTGLKENVEYYVRSFITTNDYTVYGTRVKFMSLGSKGPVLLDFSPKIGHLQDALKINGEYFSKFRKNLQVSIGGISTNILEFNSQEITVKVPSSLSVEESIISVSVVGGTSSFMEEFKLIKPIINEITPLETSVESLIEIYGENFYSGRIDVFFVDSNGLKTQAQVIYLTSTRIVARIPIGITTNEIRVAVEMNNLLVVSDQKITLIDPVIPSSNPNAR